MKAPARVLMLAALAVLLVTAVVVFGYLWASRPTPGPLPQKGQPYTNSFGMKFVWIEPGSFLMGSPDGTGRPPGKPAEPGRSDDETPHQVTLTKGFHMGAYLATQEQWERVMGKDANHSTLMGKDDAEKKMLPVDNVSWDDCQEFCTKLSALEGRKYRLPTEAEWEYACRAGTQTAYFFGNAPHDLGQYASYWADAGGEWQAVGTKKPNPWGLYDMHGVFGQWCQDVYAPYPKNDITDPVNKEEGAESGRVWRGGSELSKAEDCRAAARGRFAPGGRLRSLGLRVCFRLD